MLIYLNANVNAKMLIPKFPNHHNCSSPGYTSDLRAGAYETLLLRNTFAYETLLLRNTFAYETLLLRNTFASETLLLRNTLASETLLLMKHCMTLSSRKSPFQIVKHIRKMFSRMSLA